MNAEQEAIRRRKRLFLSLVLLRKRGVPEASPPSSFDIPAVAAVVLIVGIMIGILSIAWGN